MAKDLEPMAPRGITGPASRTHHHAKILLDIPADPLIQFYEISGPVQGRHLSANAVQRRPERLPRRIDSIDMRNATFPRSTATQHEGLTDGLVIAGSKKPPTHCVRGPLSLLPTWLVLAGVLCWHIRSDC